MPVFPEPPDKLFEPRQLLESSIETTGLPPYIVSGALQRIIEAHFSMPERIFLKKSLGTLIWKPTTEQSADTAIAIQQATDFDPNQANQRPAILVKRMQFDAQPLGMDATGRATQILADKSYAGEVYDTLWVGTHEVRCLSKTDGMSELLAQEVYQMLLKYGPVYCSEFKFSKFWPSKMGATVKVKEYGEHFCCPIQIDWAAAMRWQVRAVGPVLSHSKIEVNQVDRSQHQG